METRNQSTTRSRKFKRPQKSRNSKNRFGTGNAKLYKEPRSNQQIYKVIDAEECGAIVEKLLSYVIASVQSIEI